MIAECDRDCSGDIDFAEFIVVERQAQKAELWNDEADAPTRSRRAAEA